jgi:hypothetical protein
MLHLAMAMVDIMLARHDFLDEYFQLVGMTCLFLAAKYEQRLTLPVSALIPKAA